MHDIEVYRYIRPGVDAQLQATKCRPSPVTTDNAQQCRLRPAIISCWPQQSNQQVTSKCWLFRIAAGVFRLFTSVPTLHPSRIRDLVQAVRGSWLIREL
jgi:hypothetical protein